MTRVVDGPPMHTVSIGRRRRPVVEANRERVEGGGARGGSSYGRGFRSRGSNWGGSRGGGGGEAAALYGGAAASAVVGMGSNASPYGMNGPAGLMGYGGANAGNYFYDAATMQQHYMQYLQMYQQQVMGYYQQHYMQ